MSVAFYSPPSGTASTNALLLESGYRFLYSPTTVRMAVVGAPCAIDNGAWTAHSQGLPFDFDAFMRLVDRFAHVADWIIVPDVVGNRFATLELAATWVPRLAGAARLLVAAQDGMTAADIPEGCGVAIGGTTAWKEAALATPDWRRLPYVHVLRCNTRARIRAARSLGADSVDGSGAVMFPRKNAALMRRWSTEPMQLGLFAR